MAAIAVPAAISVSVTDAFTAPVAYTVAAAVSKAPVPVACTAAAVVSKAPVPVACTAPVTGTLMLLPMLMVSLSSLSFRS